MRISVAEAKNRLPELIKAAEDGERVTICRRGVPVADLVRTARAHGKARILGSLKDTVQVIDRDWWKPMSDQEVDDFIAGKR